MAAVVDHARPGQRPVLGVAPRQRPFTAMVVVAQPAARERVARELRALGARDVVEAGSVQQARARAQTGARELVVIEDDLPDGSGVTLLTELRSAGWSRSVVLAGDQDPYAVRGALAAGVRSYLVCSPGAAAMTPLRGRGGVEALSSREIEVLALVSQGRSNKDIGTSMGLSALTVKSHLARISRKLGTGDRAEMVMVALRAGLIH